MTFYRWLLGQENCLTLADLKQISPTIYQTLRNMEEIVRQRDEILQNDEVSDEEKNIEVSFCL